MRGGYMSPREAEEWLGLDPSVDGRSLLRAALAREKETGKEFIIRGGGAGNGVRYRFTRELIRTHLRDLWQSRFDRVASRAGAAVKRIEAHIDARIDDRIENHPTVRELASQIDETIEVVSGLSEQLERLVGVDKSRRESPPDRDEGAECRARPGS